MGIGKYTSLYYYMGTNASALKSDCIEYFEIYPKGDARHTSAIPKWLADMFNEERIVYQYGNYTYFDFFSGETSMSPHCIFLRNKYEEIKYVEPSDFDLVFERKSNLYLHERD